MDTENNITDLMIVLKNFKVKIAGTKASPDNVIDDLIDNKGKELDSGKKSGSLSHEKQKLMLKLISILEPIVAGKNGMEAFSAVKDEFDKIVCSCQAKL